MRTKRALTGLALGCLAWLVGQTPAWAQRPSVTDMLAYTPKQKGVAITLLSAEEAKGCSVQAVEIKGAIRGWLLTDAKKVPVRRFFDSKGAKRAPTERGSVDVWAYYKDGVEVYREIDTNGDNVPDQFRWIHAGGMKWGVDRNGDSSIDQWLMISAEEVAEEAFLAVQEKNAQRFAALLINEAELRSLKLPAEKADQLRKTLQGAQAKFDKCKAELDPRAVYVRVEPGVPSCVPADDMGGEQDLIHFSSRPVMYELPDTKDVKGKRHDWLHTGEMVQVGMAWRLVDAPSTQVGPSTPDTPMAGVETPDPQEQKLLERLAVIDSKQPDIMQIPPGTLSKPVQDYNLARIQVIQELIRLPSVTKDAKKYETWIKQICDNLANAHVAGHGPSLSYLKQYRDQLEKGQPSSNLAGYAVYRHTWASYANKLMPNPADKDALAKLPETQERYNDELAKFVRAYPRAEDTAEALHQLAMGSEFGGKDEAAKGYYKSLAEAFPEHPYAAKSRGAIDRLNLIGNELKLAGPMLTSKQPFNVTSLRGKVVLVYYWSSIASPVGDFARLKQAKSKAGNDLELVLVNLDDRESDAVQFLSRNPLAGTHLYQAPPPDSTGMQSAFAVQYGILGLPHMFLVGKDGKVLQRTLQISDVEDAVKKAQ